MKKREPWRRFIIRCSLPFSRLVLPCLKCEDQVLPAPEGWLSRSITETLIRSSQRVIIQDRERSFSGLDLIKLFSSIKSHLESSTREGSRVAILLPNSAAQGLAILAVFYCKRVPVIFAPDLPEGKFEERLHKFECHAVISNQAMLGEQSLSLPLLYVDAGAQVVGVKGSGYRSPYALTDSRVALVLFTSGSTGEPKGVQLTHDGLFYVITHLTNYFGLNSESRAAICLPIFHTMALNTQFLPTFLSGGTCVFMNSEEDHAKAYSMIVEAKATFLAVIGDILFLYDKERELRNLPPAEDVRHIQMAGGVIRKDHLQTAKRLFPNARIHKGYGMTEVIRTAMIHSDQPGFMDDSVGYVLPGQTVEIRGEEQRPLKTGEVGEIYIKCPSMMLGYQGEESVLDGRGFLASGDLGYLDAKGRLFFCGRTDEIFKMRGKKVSTVEIEKTALNMDMIVAAKCISVPCKRKGYKPVLFVQTVKNYERRIEDLCGTVRKYLFERLERYKVPADVLIVESLPKLANQKINRRAVYDLWLRWDERS